MIPVSLPTINSEPFQKEKRKSSRFFPLLIVLPFLFQGCTKSDSLCELTQSEPKKGHIQLLSRISPKMGILLETDSNQDGKINDWLWMKGEETKREEMKLFFNEIQDEKGIIVEEIWYGPGNQKLIGKLDLNKDGKLETTVYYNKNAKPKNTNGIVARMEIDSDLDGKTDIWIYPGQRVELDKSKLGFPNEYTEDSKLVTQIFENLSSSKPSEPKLKALPKENSWAVNPQLIKEELNKAIIPFSY